MSLANVTLYPKPLRVAIAELRQFTARLTELESPIYRKDLRDSVVFAARALAAGMWDDEEPEDVLALTGALEAAELALDASEMGLAGKWRDFFRRARARRKKRYADYKKRRKERRSRRKRHRKERRAARKATRGKGLKARVRALRKVRKRQRKERKEQYKEHRKRRKMLIRQDRAQRKLERKNVKSGVAINRDAVSPEEAAAASGADEAIAAEGAGVVGPDGAALPEGAEGGSIPPEGGEAGSGSFLWPTDKPIYLRPAFLGGMFVLLAAGGIVIVKTKKKEEEAKRLPATGGK